MELTMDQRKKVVLKLIRHQIEKITPKFEIILEDSKKLDYFELRSLIAKINKINNKLDKIIESINWESIMEDKLSDSQLPP